MNGLTEKDMANIDKIEKIDLVLEEIRRMRIICKFKKLTSLTLISTDIMEIEVFYIWTLLRNTIISF